MTVKMPAPDQTVLDRRDRIVRALRAIVPGEGVIATESEMRPYESDALTAYRQLPLVVVLPATRSLNGCAPTKMAPSCAACSIFCFWLKAPLKS